MATPAEFLEARRAARAAAENRKTIVARLLERVKDGGPDDALLGEAAQHLQWYEASAVRARQDANEAAKEMRAAISEAYSDGRFDERDSVRGY